MESTSSQCFPCNISATQRRDCMCILSLLIKSLSFKEMGWTCISAYSTPFLMCNPILHVEMQSCKQHIIEWNKMQRGEASYKQGQMQMQRLEPKTSHNEGSNIMLSIVQKLTLLWNGTNIVYLFNSFFSPPTCSYLSFSLSNLYLLVLFPFTSVRDKLVEPVQVVQKGKKLIHMCM